MNTTPDSAPQPPLPAGGFFAWIRGLGITRSNDRWFAGVAGGIAAKAKIDPLIVRGIFVVLALLGGPGILLYLVGWLLLPDTTGRIRMEDLIRGRVEGWTIVALVVVTLSAIPMLFNLFTPSVFGWSMAPWGFFGFPSWLSTTITWLVWIAIIVVAWIWLHRVATKRSRTGRAEYQPGAADTASASASEGSTSDAWGEDFGKKAEAWGESFGQKAEAWGESFGQKADAWGEDFGHRAEHWGTQYGKRYEARKIGAAHVLITFALALLAAGGAAIWAHSPGSPVLGQAGPVVTSLVAALAVFALSLIVAGIRGRNTGWIGFLSACGVVTLLFTAILPWGTQFQPFGTLSVQGVHSPGAVLIAGNTRLDMSGASNKAATPRDGFAIWQLFGNSTVTLPDNTPVVVDVRLLAGNIEEHGGNAAGPLLARSFSNTEKPSSSATRVTVYLVFGNVRIVNPHGDTLAEVEPGSGSHTNTDTQPSDRTERELESAR